VQSREECISSRDYARLRKLVYEEAGINLGEQKKTMLEGRIRRRLKELAIHSYGDYCNYLFSDQGFRNELVHLIDVVSTNKTDFFREPKHFEFLTSRMLPEWARSTGNRRPLLVWSAGCSSGEEPYTLAIVLSEFEQTHPGFSFRILATDISNIVLGKASVGIYSTDAVGPVPQNLKKKYFMRGREPGSVRTRVVPELRQLIEFRRLNFMDSDYGIAEKFDAIFCRNVIIYFDRQTQQSILGKITRRLLPEGYLFMGHSETLHELDLPVIQVLPALYKRADARA
jgi:chemotaxis protein methyltransferase CheR